MVWLAVSMPPTPTLFAAFLRGVATVQSLLPAQRALAPSQAAGAQYLALGVLTALLYVAASAALGAFTAKAPPARLGWWRGVAARGVRAYAQVSFALLGVALLLEAPQHALRAGAAIAGGGSAPPARLVWTWVIALLFAANDLLLALLGAVRPLVRLVALVAPTALRGSAGFGAAEVLGELGAAADLLVPRLGMCGLCLMLSLLGRK